MKHRWITVEPGITKIAREGGNVFRVQLGSAKKGDRRAKTCKTYEEAKALKAEWRAGGKPAAPDGQAPAALPSTTVTLVDAIEAYAAGLNARASSRSRALQLVPVLERYYPELAALDGE